MKNIVISPQFTLKWNDFKSVLTGLLLMTAGTLATALIDALLSFVSGLQIDSITVGGYPILVYLIPLVTALLNLLRKYIQETRYAK